MQGSLEDKTVDEFSLPIACIAPPGTIKLARREAVSDHSSE